MSLKPVPDRVNFVSIRLKLLLSFTVLFSGVFAISFYWFYNFSTEKAMKRVFDDMQSTALGTAANIDVSQLMDLYYYGEAPQNPDDLSDDPRYLEQINWFKTVNELEPRAWPYTFVLLDPQVMSSEKGNAIAASDILPLPPGQRPRLADSKAIQELAPDTEVRSVFLADLWMLNDLSKAARLFELSTASEYTLEAYRQGQVINRPLYNDEQFGRWISTYVPLKDEGGKTRAILGVDFEADYVRQVQAAIRNRVLVAFILTYLALFALVYFLANLFAKPISHLTEVAEQIGEGNYNHDFKTFEKNHLADEITILANVFSLMMDKVRQREEKLKQQVARLKIEIDESKRDTEVKQITESEFFQDLRAKVIHLRQRKNQALEEPDKSESVNEEGTTSSEE